jgi:hypothetical protein
MKRILYTLSCILLLSTASYAQDERGNGDRIRERMTEYLQERLNLSRNEAERFGPVFMQYFNDLKNTNQQYRGDRLVLQQKIVDLRLRYRDQFKNIMGEKRSNDVFTYEREFVNEVKEIQKQRLQNRGNRRGQ